MLRVIVAFWMTAALSSGQLFFMTSGPNHDLRRLNLTTGSESLIVGGLAAPSSANAAQYSHMTKSGRILWSDLYTGSTVRTLQSSLVTSELPSVVLHSATQTYRGVAADSTRFYVADETAGCVVSGALGQAVATNLKCGFTTLTGLSIDEDAQQLYWIADLKLFSGSTTGAATAEVFDLVNVAAVTPEVLAINPRFRRALWTDSGTNCAYSLDLVTLTVAQQCFTNPVRVRGVATDVSTGIHYVSTLDPTVPIGATTIRVFGAPGAPLYSRPVSTSCCGDVGPIAVFTLGNTGACSLGTYTEACLPCAQGSFSTVAGSLVEQTCAGACTTSQYCELAAAVAIDSALAQNRLAVTTPVFNTSILGASSNIPLLFLAISLGIVGLVFIVFALMVVFCRHRHRDTFYPKIKACCQGLDIFFRSRHRNETPGLMLHRKSVFGGFQSLTFPAIFIILAVFVGLQWNAYPVVTSTVLPFGHLERFQRPQGGFVATGLFYGFAGQCAASSLIVATDGFSSDVGTFVSDVQDLGTHCRVSWRATSNLTFVSTLAGVRLTLTGGHAAFVGFEVGAFPHYLEPFYLKDVRDGDAVGPNPYVNFVAGTELPSAGSVFKGSTPTVIDVATSYVQFNDSSIVTSIGYSRGWELTGATVTDGAQATAANFGTQSNEVSLSFRFDRGATYVFVEAQPATAPGILIGAIFGYGATVMAVLVILGKAMEWCSNWRGKARSHAHAFFMRPYESDPAQMEELSHMTGYKQPRAENAPGTIFHKGESGHHIGKKDNDLGSLDL